MQRIRLLYEQVEEAKRLISSRTLLQLRLALILLDNAAELMMYRELDYQFAMEDYFARSTVRLPGKQKYTEAERRRAEQEFRPKVKLSQGLGIFQASRRPSFACATR
jgi:hypothetical protein